MKSLKIIAAQLETLQAMPRNSLAERFYAARGLRQVRTDITAIIKDWETDPAGAAPGPR